jgi:hypothetical protein
MCFTDASGFVWLQQHTLTKFIIKVICTTTFFYKKAKKKDVYTQRNATLCHAASCNKNCCIPTT